MHAFYYWCWLAVLSLITFFLYGMDKDRAKRDDWRIPEAVLHWLAILGGFTGGWLGRAFFHHKTRKGFFTFILALGTLFHVGIVYLLFFR
jgi:uncharacterized membrane protein YsdA (DUF1294 family)